MIMSETQSFKPISFIPTRVEFDERGDLAVKGYFLNSGPDTEIVTAMHMEVYSVIKRISPRLITAVEYNSTEIVVPPGEAQEHTFLIAEVEPQVIDYWRVLSRYSWKTRS